MWPHMGSMGWWMVLWWVAGIVVLVLLVWWLERPADSRPEATRRLSRSSNDVYAKGEIERDEYQRRLEDLRR